MTLTSRDGVAAFLGKVRRVFRGAAGFLAVAAICAPLGAQRVTGPEISAGDIEAHVRALAGDEMRGRETGSAESLEAALYIAGVMRRAGLEAAGDSGSYLQATRVSGVSFDAVPELVALDADGQAMDAVFGVDFDYWGGGSLDATLDLVVVKESSDLPAEPRADTALLMATSPNNWMRWLEAAGTPDGEGWGLVVVAGRDSRRGPRTEPPKGMVTTGEPPMLIARGAFRDRLMEGEFERLRVAMRASGVPQPAVNVIGIIRGVGTEDDPSLAEQAVVFTAHYDHIGVADAPETKAEPHGEHDADDGHDGHGDHGEHGDGAASEHDDGPTGPLAGLEAGIDALAGALGEAEDEGPDLIYNGADDDASGVAAVLELAEAFAKADPPARTLVFLAVTGEERGLIGTWHYLDHPVVPLDRTIVNINFEMVGRPDELAGGQGRFWLTGFERTDLGPAWEAAGLPIARDMRPEQHFFERSDNIAFVRRGIVGQSLSSYNLHEDYHQVTDEADTLDYRHMEIGMRTTWDAVRMIADGTLMPAWEEQESEGGADGTR
jgi:hypothetical protein